jgi:AcrR family transcriptional regulator
MSDPGGPTKATSGSRAGRPRSQEVDRRINAAALGLLRSGGPAVVTVEAVAAESGVAKTTIYRRYADRDEVLRAALADVIGEPVEPAEGTTRDKVRSLLDQKWRQMAEVFGAGGLSAVVAESDPRFSELFRHAITPYNAAIVALLQAEAERGELRSDLDAETVVTLFVGAYFGQLVRHGVVDDRWAERCLDLMWVAMTRE